jgi:hypothetical protein
MSANELDALAIQAGAVDGAVEAQEPGAVMAAQAEIMTMGLAEENSQGVTMILGIAVPVLGKLYPSLADVYTDEACGAIAASLGPLLAKYGVNLKDWGGAYKEEIGAAIVCGPIAWATVQGIKADIAARAGPKAAQVVDASDKAQTKGAGPVPGDFEFREPAA